MKAPAETVVIVDFGAQYSQLIARRVREEQVYCEILPFDAPWADIERRNAAAFILTGGPESVAAPGAPHLTPELLRTDKPILGICYGMQELARAGGGTVVPGRHREYGRAELVVDAGGSPLFGGVPSSSQAWMSHGDTVTDLPAGYVALAHTSTCALAAVGDEGRKRYGVQFHPEVNHTEHGRLVLRNFLREIAGLRDRWEMSGFVDAAVRDIRAAIGDAKAICALSGGVDSAVAATLVSRAIGDRLTCIFVDHGLLRQDEARLVVEAFRDVLHLNLIGVDARERFLGALAGVEDPEEKRQIIGREFIEVFNEHAKQIPGAEFLIQGTLYPDVIESKTPQSKSGAKIKTHHNVGGLPEIMHLKLVEPLRMLFKDEVRRLGRELGLDPHIVDRQPFPGPGLAVRILGVVDEERLDVLRRADAITREEIERAETDHPWQYFAVLTPLRSVGVMGDGRTYGNLVAIRAVTSDDGMTADWARLPAETLQRISNRIVNEIPAVNRVVYDVTSKPPATIEWE
ncbi:MAG: GMP synthase (glutamine-hydrolyzing) [Candidatus Eremiobacter antarcticus]|nr:glutamine-hydrolyzing GMP synthase [Candidatus Eremiobacteraeota bacterium]MBC5809060.1 glutamine-hydrolyzing GMP synthase [Candidatus Eremiobacteraeota bacterium]PZR64366.1 MAG: GMP synthase (glutamine-hydrolyzing) [Candidatus Eremiobacter sp. RRmetagenome_bin22]